MFLVDCLQRDTLGFALASEEDQVGITSHFEPALAAEGMQSPEFCGDKQRGQAAGRAIGEFEQHGGGVIDIDPGWQFVPGAMGINLADQTTNLDQRIEVWMPRAVMPPPGASTRVERQMPGFRP